ncbi:MAG TPA: phage holin family protein [Kofleriaceae bacterium]|nr:phage holin family protein [Kofleriaceae bacterium]
MGEIQKEPTKDLFTGLIADAKELAVGHLTRMQGEMKDEFGNLKAMMVKIAAAVGVMVLGGILVGHFLAAVLVALGLPWWAGYGIAAAVLIAVGLVILKMLPDNKKDVDMIPETSLRKLKRDAKVVKHDVSKAVSAH